MKSSLCSLGAAALLSLAAFASTPAQGQTNSDALVIAPKNSAVKVIDSSTPNALSITMVSEPTQAAQKNTAARADKVDTSVLNQWRKIERPVHHVKQSGKKASKEAEQKKKASTLTAREDRVVDRAVHP